MFPARTFNVLHDSTHRRDEVSFIEIDSENQFANICIPKYTGESTTWLRQRHGSFGCMSDTPLTPTETLQDQD